MEMHSPPFLYCLGKYLPAFLYLEAARVETKRNTEEGIFRTTQRYRRTGFAGLKASAKSLIVRSVMKYRFREPLLAILKGPVSSVAFLTIKRGSVITVKPDEQEYGLVEVDYDGKIVLAFMRGIELRADRVRGQAI